MGFNYFSLPEIPASGTKVLISPQQEKTNTHKYFVEEKANPLLCNRVCHLAAIAGAVILIPWHIVKSLQLIWRSGTRRFHLRVPDLQMSCSDFTKWSGTNVVVPVMATRVTCRIVLSRYVCIPIWGPNQHNFPVNINTHITKPIQGP